MHTNTGLYFPNFIRAFPQPDSPYRGLQAWMLQAANGMATFFEAADRVVVSRHTHGAQWGVVLEGRLELKIGDKTHEYARGDTYFIPAGVPHSAVLHPGCIGIDVFADSDRYQAKAPPEYAGATREGPRARRRYRGQRS